MSRRRFVAALSAISFVIAARGAQAQRLAPLAVAAPHSTAPTRAERDTIAQAEGSRVAHTARGALIGTGAGAVLGIGMGAIAAAGNTNHEDDVAIFAILGTLGALAGLVVGSVISVLAPP